MLRPQPSCDRRPGPLPLIQAESDSITFAMTPSGTREHELLVIRCDTNGEVWISIQHARTPTR